MSRRRHHNRIAATILALVLLAAAGWGQTRRHDVSLQAGFMSPDQVEDWGDPVPITIALGSFFKTGASFSAVPFLTYHYSANSRFGFGGAFGYFSASGQLAVEGGAVVVGDFKEKSYVGALELDYHWIMKPGLQLYSGAGVGIRVRSGTYHEGGETESETKVLPAFHLNALGVRFGKAIGFFAELGIGYKGVLAVGVNGHF
jgi:hypothetical protein